MREEGQGLVFMGKQHRERRGGDCQLSSAGDCIDSSVTCRSWAMQEKGWVGEEETDWRETQFKSRQVEVELPHRDVQGEVASHWLCETRAQQRGLLEGESLLDVSSLQGTVNAIGGDHPQRVSRRDEGRPRAQPWA